MARIEINLLPRELRKKSRVTTFDKYLTYVAAFVGILMALFVAVSVLQGIKLKALDVKIAEAQRRTNQLKGNIELVDALTQLKDKILQRMSAIEVLDRNRAVWVRVLEDLSQRVPDYLWFSLLKEEESGAKSSTKADSGKASTPPTPSTEPEVRKVTIEGFSYSLNSLASFLIQLSQSQYFRNMELQYVKRSETKEYKTFSFQLIGDLYHLPEVETPSTDTSTQKLAGGVSEDDSAMQDPGLSPKSTSEIKSDTNLIAGRE